MARDRQIRDIELVTPADEIDSRISDLAAHTRLVEVFQFSDIASGGMTPNQFEVWLQLARTVPDAVMNGNGIYRPKNHSELVTQVLMEMYNERTRYGQHQPAVSYEELVDAGHLDRAAELLEEYGDQARKENQAVYNGR